jgi:16S rRNA (cytidine1402-2'-O)-methyltransferase
LSKLYLIPTPIGNLADITLRALHWLKNVDLILAEDTRQTAILLQHYQIQKPLQSYHAHNEHQHLQRIIDQLKGGTTIGLVTDAGTPGISDPGFLLARQAIREGIAIETLPGATAFVPALINSGLPADRFVFEGFLPQKKGKQSRLNALQNETRTMIFYESPFRLLKTLEQLSAVLGSDRPASVSRELTKMFEETTRGTLQEIIQYYSAKTIKGEIVIVVAGKTD